jgi:thioredoxin reductase (NADPH)
MYHLVHKEDGWPGCMPKRAPSLAASMSEYLIRQIAATPNIDVRYRVQAADGTGTSAGHLRSLVLQDTASGAWQTVPADALFVLIGAQPRTRWLGDTVATATPTERLARSAVMRGRDRSESAFARRP